jgi:hypothetical protein
MDASNEEVYFSFNTRIINKNDRKDTYALANGWEHVTGSVDDLLRVIKSGCAYSAWFQDGVRNTKNFVGTNLVSIDIDGTNKIDTTIEHEFSQKHLTALYTSCSHTAEEHRFRLIFRLERVIESTKEYRDILRALQMMYSGDRASAEPARLFYGNDQAQVQSWDRFIPNDEIDRLILLNTQPEWDNNNHHSAYASNRSKIHIPLDQPLKTGNGKVILFGEAPARTPIFCPHHHDTKASAFIGINYRGSRFIHCVACQTTWFQINPLSESNPEIKLDFVETLRSIKNMSRQEMEAELKKLPVEFDTSEVHDANVSFINQKYVDIKAIKPGLTLIRSPKGSGKTHSLVSIIENIYFRKYAIDLSDFELTDDDEGPPQSWETGKTVLLIGHRQALIRSMCQRLDLNCYLDETKQDGVTNRRDFRKRYGICLDSIKKIQSLDSHVKTYDLVIIDEVEQVLAHLLAETSRDAAGYLETLSRIVAFAESVIVMDADLGWTSFLTLTSMRNGSNCYLTKHRNEIIINEYVAEQRVMDVYDLKTELISHLVSDVVSGKRVFVSTNSKKQVDRLKLALHEKLPEKSIIAITSENSNSKIVNEFISDIQNQARKYDVVISSPSLGTGIDITFSENEEFYDSVYGIYEALVNGHTEIDQQLSRVRHPKSVKVWVSPRKFNFETNFDVIKSDLLFSNVIANTAVDVHAPQAEQVFLDNSQFLRTAALILSTQRTSKNRLKQNFLEYKSSQGWIPNIISSPDDKPLGVEMDRLGKKLELEVYAERLIAAKPISEFEYLRIEESLQDEENVSDEEFRSYQRMKLELFYCRQIDLIMITEDDRWTLRKQYGMYKRISDKKVIEAYLERQRVFPIKYVQKNLRIIKDDMAAPYLLRGVLLSTPVFGDEGFKTDVEFNNADLAGFAKTCEKMKSIIETQLGISLRVDLRSKSSFQLGVFLKVVGIQTIKSRTEKNSDGGKTYFYKIDPKSLIKMEGLLAMEDRRKNQWELINTRYGFN